MAEPVRPPELFQVGCTGGVIGKNPLKFWEVGGEASGIHALLYGADFPTFPQFGNKPDRHGVNKEELDEARVENAALQAQLAVVTREREAEPRHAATVGWLRFQAAHSAAGDVVELTARDAGLRETLAAFEVAQVYPDQGGAPVFKIEVRKRGRRHY